MGDRSGLGQQLSAEGQSMARRHLDVIIYEDDCKSCDLCIDICPRDVLEYQRPHLKPKVANLDACTGCRLCELLCPDWAISVEIMEPKNVGGG
jgi:2-oxoglutarate ferredoxin oxidoreductase subunit delta